MGFILMFKIGDIVYNGKKTCLVFSETLHDESRTNIISLTRGFIVFKDYRTLEDLTSDLKVLQYKKIAEIPITFKTNEEVE
jgi:hypothetical protein